MIAPKSLRFRLLGLWFMLALSAGATAFLLFSFFEETAAAQVERAQERAVQACRTIGDRYAFFAAGWQGLGAEGFDAEIKSQLVAVTQTALSRMNGIEGGVWHAETGPLAYAFPTYEGSGPKTDLPAAELTNIQDVNAAANNAGKVASIVRKGNSQVLVLVACPLPGPVAGMTGWAMTRVFTGTGEAYQRLLVGLGVLSITVLGSALWLGWILIAWSRRIARIESDLARLSDDSSPRLALTGERELDRLVEALNASGERLKEARVRAAASERLAAVGHLTSGVAHEIRNPIAAMRLKAENALAADDDRRVAALRFMLDQIARLDRLLRDLLTMSHRREPHREDTELSMFLTGISDDFQEIARAKGVRLVTSVPQPDAGVAASFDRDQLRRAIENLLTNAIQHTERGGIVTLRGGREDDHIVIEVADTGPGIAPDIADRLFEPFVTGRADGTGLGLAIVRELVDANHGKVRVMTTPAGARFRIELPCVTSQ